MKTPIYLEGFIKLVTELYSSHGHQVQSVNRVDDYSADLHIKSKKNEEWFARCSIRPEVDVDSITPLLMSKSISLFSNRAYFTAGAFTESAQKLAQENNLYLFDGEKFQSQLQSARASEKEKILGQEKSPTTQQKFSNVSKKGIIAVGIIVVAMIFGALICGDTITRSAGSIKDYWESLLDNAPPTTTRSAPATLPPAWTPTQETVIEDVRLGRVFGQSAEIIVDSLNASGYSFIWNGDNWDDRSLLTATGVSYRIVTNSRGEVNSIVLGVSTKGYDADTQGLMWAAYLYNCGVDEAKIATWLRDHNDEIKLAGAIDESFEDVVDGMVLSAKINPLDGILVLALVDIATTD